MERYKQTNSPNVLVLRKHSIAVEAGMMRRILCQQLVACSLLHHVFASTLHVSDVSACHCRSICLHYVHYHSVCRHCSVRDKRYIACHLLCSAVCSLQVTLGSPVCSRIANAASQQTANQTATATLNSPLIHYEGCEAVYLGVFQAGQASTYICRSK